MERHLEAITLIGPDDERLDHIALQSVRHGARIVLLLPRLLVRRLLGSRLIQIFVQDIHVPRKEVEKPAQRDFHVDRRDVIFLDGRCRRAPLPVRDRDFVRVIRHQQHALLHHVTAGTRAVPALLSDKFLLPLDLVHHAIVKN